MGAVASFTLYSFVCVVDEISDEIRFAWVANCLL